MPTRQRLLGTIVSTLAALAAGWLLAPSSACAAEARPNILWITCEDISPNLGCYGDDYAVTPTLDRFAEESVLYTNAFAPIGVCAPARSCLITGMYPPSLGSQHMRCKGTLPEFVRGYSEYLRKAGYYCTNNSKTDYNWNAPKSTWDESSRKAHWRNRPKKDQPFFAIFNITLCHESQIRLPEKRYQARMKQYGITPHDPAQARVPAYHPDTPEVRQDWARYADMITVMDHEVAKILAQLEEDGLAEETIVWFYSDHGAGMPRSKRWLYDSSLRVPLMIRFPEKHAHLAASGPGTKTDRLVNFIDFGPTALSLAGVTIPEHMQGEAFLGEQARPPRRYIYGFRDRMDERYDMIRCVRDKRYKYIRNYMPQLPWFHEQYISYMYQMPTMQVWQKLADAGQLSGATATFMAHSKPTEELYDTQADPDEVHNLADSPEHQEILERLRTEQRRFLREVVDLGLLPEPDLRTRFGGRPPYVVVREQPDVYPLERIAEAANLANRRDPAALPALQKKLTDDDPAVRYWAAVGIGSLGKHGAPASGSLRKALSDDSPTVRVTAADALCRLGRYDEAVPVLAQGLEDDNEWVRLYAANHLDRIDEHARGALEALRKARKDKNGYVVRVVGHALEGLQ